MPLGHGDMGVAVQKDVAALHPVGPVGGVVDVSVGGVEEGAFAGGERPDQLPQGEAHQLQVRVRVRIAPDGHDPLRQGVQKLRRGPGVGGVAVVEQVPQQEQLFRALPCESVQQGPAPGHRPVQIRRDEPFHDTGHLLSLW